MSVVTFCNSSIEQTGKTMSVAAIATYMAIEHNYRTIIISTTNRKDLLQTCFFKENKKLKKNLGIFGPNAGVETESGINGLSRIMRSNKISPDIITNYAKVVFRDRLEILLGSTNMDSEIAKTYPDIIEAANQYYDLVFVDLDENVGEDVKNSLIHTSDVVVVNLSQRLTSIDAYLDYKEKNQKLETKKVLLLLGRYDKFSKYNVKNITRYMKEKNDILTIPYNTLFFEASEEAGVPDLFLKFKKNLDPEDRNFFFVDEVRRACDNIIYKMQDLQMNM